MYSPAMQMQGAAMAPETSPWKEPRKIHSKSNGLALLDHGFARVCWTWRRSSILDFLRFKSRSKVLILGLKFSLSY
jgi:hypothetical protein